MQSAQKAVSAGEVGVGGMLSKYLSIFIVLQIISPAACVFWTTPVLWFVFLLACLSGLLRSPAGALFSCCAPGSLSMLWTHGGGTRSSAR